MTLFGRKLALAALIVAACPPLTEAFAAAGAEGRAPAPAKPSDDLTNGIPSREALQRKTALKLAGLATFVTTSCPDLNLDPERFKTAVASLGIPPGELENNDNKLAYLSYTMTYKKDVKANCARARVEFGPGGKTLPGLFVVVDASKKAPAAPGTSTPAAPGAAAPGGK